MAEGNRFEFSPEERGFEFVDEDEVLYTEGRQQDATGKVFRRNYEVREAGGEGFYPQRVDRALSGEIVGKDTIGRRRQTREEAVNAVENRVSRSTAKGFGGFEVGDFVLNSESSIDVARAAHLSRSDTAQIADRSKRAPITTNAKRYAQAPGQLDYPGVDTPRADPLVMFRDLAQEQQPRTTETETPNRERRDALFEFPPEDDRARRGEFYGELAARDVSLSPGEAFRGVGASSSREIGGFSPAKQRETDRDLPVPDDVPLESLDPMTESEVFSRR